ncbi:MAG: LysM peptidoglycan-binding domain-containing protein [Proteobacteria bacterium]|nr:LysM peptidoglycan-binding domain-containing protein [Pseudomonadota bacterium]MBU1708912.1 LysM peptidoglycan-binding domain-containing protein [Pseudomonadota bacterium]
MPNRNSCIAAICSLFFLLLISGCASTRTSSSDPVEDDEPQIVEDQSEELTITEEIILPAEDTLLEAENDAAQETEEDPQASTEKLSEELTASETEATVEEEVKQLEALGSWEEGTPEEVTEEAEVNYDFPVTMNRQVEFYLDFFQNKQRQTFTKWLARSGKYLPLIQQQLKEKGLPLDLAYLPMIESGYNLTAYSRARAVGPWQFMRATGRKYGLTVNDFVDERRDPVKSSAAAIAYLSYLYEDFKSWHLAVAAYNAGEGKIRKAVRKYKTNNFWEIAQERYLRPETKLYVPKLIAAILIAKEPEKYGFTDIEYDEPFEYETVEVPRWTTIQAVSVAIDMDFEELRNYNRELRRAITPAEQKRYPLKVPIGTKELVEQNLPRVQAVMTTKYQTHKVLKGDTLTKICSKYNLNKTTLLKANDLQASQLIPGKNLRIPYRTTEYKLLSENEIASKIKPAEASPENLVLHKVRPGETISEISKRYGAPPYMIAAWNNLPSIHSIRAGQQLALYLTDEDKTLSPKALSAFEYTTPITTVTTVAKRIPETETEENSDTQLTYYQVQGGDTLWTIAKRYNLTPDKIRRWNQIKGDTIYPGHRLLLKIKKDVDV